MKLLIEQSDNIITEVVETPGKGKKYYIKGIMLQSHVVNRNFRIYAKPILDREVERYNREFIATRRALSELSHPDNPQINLDKVSHLIEELYPDGNNFIGKALVLDTPNGRILKAFIDENVLLGCSSRGLGSLKENSQGVQEVQDDYHLTAIDCVLEPSSPDAWTRGLVENREWLWNSEGVLQEDVLAKSKKIIKAAPSKQLEETILREFSKFLKLL